MEWKELALNQLPNRPIRVYHQHLVHGWNIYSWLGLAKKKYRMTHLLAELCCVVSDVDCSTIIPGIRYHTYSYGLPARETLYA